MVSYANGIDVSMVGNDSCATTTAVYKPAYLVGENLVGVMDTTTSYGKFLGVLQDYTTASGGAVIVRVRGVTKGILNTDSTTAGDLVEVLPTTSVGGFKRGSIRAADAASMGAVTTSVETVGRVVRGSQGGTNSVFSFIIQPNLSSAPTTAVGASA